MKPCDRCCKPIKSGKHCRDCHKLLAPRTAHGTGRKSSGVRYGKAWSKPGGFRDRHLAEEPLCRACRAKGKTVPATLVDHIIPFVQDMGPADWIFYLEGNHQSLCTRCHDQKRARESRGRGAALRAQFKTPEQAKQWLQKN